MTGAPGVLIGVYGWGFPIALGGTSATAFARSLSLRWFEKSMSSFGSEGYVPVSVHGAQAPGFQGSRVVGGRGLSNFTGSRLQTP